jgi:hypothetical protein
VAFEAASPDASVVIFSTADSLDFADSDNATDVYERRDGTTTLLSDDADPAEPDEAQPVAVGDASADAERVFLVTKAKLLANDTDAAKDDVYLRHAGTTTRVTTGPQNDNGSRHHQLVGITPDGAHAYFHTTEQLVAADADGPYDSDVYEWTGGQTRIVSDREGADASGVHATFVDAAEDGSRVAFYTVEHLTDDDTDDVYDIFVREGAALRKVSPGNGPHTADLLDATPSLDTILLSTEEALTGQDGDAFYDVYRASTGASPQTELVSRRTADGPGANAGHVNYDAASDDLTTVYFSSSEAMTADDTDSGAGEDVFVRTGGTTRLVTPTLADDEFAYVDVMRASADGRSLIVESDRPMAEGDTDDRYDVYEWRDGTTRQLTPGNGPADATFVGAADDHPVTYVWAYGALVEADVDEAWDVYAVRTLPHEQPKPDEQPREELPQPRRDDPPADDRTPREEPRGPAADRTAPATAVSGAKSQRVLRAKGIRVTVRADEAATATLRARVKVGGRSITVRGLTRALAAGRPASALLKFASRDLATLKRVLRPGRTAAATITVIVSDAAGNASTRSLKLKLRR